MRLAACEIVCEVGGAVHDRTDGESDIVNISISSEELTFRWDAAMGMLDLKRCRSGMS